MENKDKTTLILQGICKLILAFFTALGHSVVAILNIIKSGLTYVRRHRLVERLFRKIKIKSKRGLIRLGRFLIKIKNIIIYPFVTAFKSLKLVRNTVVGTKGLPFGTRVKVLLKEFFGGLKRHSIIFKTAVNYTLPIIAVYFLVMVISQATQVNFVVSIDYNGKNIGYVGNEYVVETAKQMVDDRMIYLDESERVEIKPSYSIKTMDNRELLTEYELADELISLSSDDMIEADGLYVNGEFMGAVEDIGVIQKTLDTMLEPYKTSPENDGAVIGFTKDVQVVSGLYITQNIVSTEQTVNMLTGETQGEVYHEVQGNDTLSGLAQKYGMKTADIYALNPNVVPEKMRDGDLVLISQKEAFLPVQVVKNISYTEEIPYTTEVTKSSAYTVNVKKVTQEGVNGQNQITAEVTYIDGAEVSRNILSTQVTQAPVTELITEGTAPLVVNSSTGSGKVDTGFQWPMQGYVSSSYGPRWGSFHGGIDVARYGGAYGAPIYAVTSGTVIFASYSGDYGKLVKIDHGNGLQTWYAHCSSISVSSGQRVSGGQLIANAGSTGRVTGPHLHFEVRVNGVRQDPMKYLP